MRNFILLSFCLVVAPGAVFGQHSNWDKAINAAERAYGDQHYREAELQFVRAEKEAESFGPSDRRLAMTLNNLGGLYLREARYAESEPLFKRALAIWEKGGESTNGDRATALNNLGALYAYQSRFAEAEPIYLQCLTLSEKNLGADHPSVASTLNNLGALYWEEGKFTEAEPFYRRAVFIREKNLGPENPELASSLNNLAALEIRQGQIYGRRIAV